MIYILIYVVDMTVFFEHKKKIKIKGHLQHWACVLQKMKEAGLTLKPSKCRFAAKKGNIPWSPKKGIEVDQTTIKIMVNIPTPNTVLYIRQHYNS